MREAVFVSTARTAMTKSHRGEFNITPGATLAAAIAPTARLIGITSAAPATSPSELPMSPAICWP